MACALSKTNASSAMISRFPSSPGRHASSAGACRARSSSEFTRREQDRDVKEYDRRERESERTQTLPETRQYVPTTTGVVQAPITLLYDDTSSVYLISRLRGRGYQDERVVCPAHDDALSATHSAPAVPSVRHVVVRSRFPPRRVSVFCFRFRFFFFLRPKLGA